MYTHPDILDVQVVGVPDARLGEAVTAWVILKEEASLTTEDVKAYCKDQISHFKIPRDIFFVSEYPMTASGKIQKYKLREQAASYTTARP
ncbi:hypothetical protein [Geomicrobium sp. JCM 19037]|nr:hypothetical protein [Geomicrobium sp. JCM 19037]